MNIYGEIRKCKEEFGYSQRGTAKRLGISRKTVRKYWNGDTIPGNRKEGSGRKNNVLTEEHLDFIKECLESDKGVSRKQHHTARRIYQRLCDEKGYTGCEAGVRAAVALLRKNVSQCFIPLEYDPGEAIQVDFGEIQAIIHGEKKRLYIWCMRECYSCDMFVMAFYRQNQESFLEGLQIGLEHFGGTPKRIIFDNGSVAVKDGKGKNAKPTDGYQAFAAHYVFEPVFCNAAQGHEKGLVEGLVGYARKNYCVPIPNFESIEALNEYLLTKCIAYREKKRENSEYTVGEMYEIAKLHLKQLPSYRLDTAKKSIQKVNDLALVKFDQNRYSVPYTYTNREVTIKGYANKVVILCDNKIIAEHPRCFQRQQDVFQLEHYMDLISIRPRSVYNASPIKKTIPKKLYAYLMQMNQPKDIIEALKLYLENPDIVMDLIEKTNPETFLETYVDSGLSHNI